MKLIHIEAYTQITGVAATNDTIVVDLSTRKKYYHNGSAWKEYFEFSNGGNISVTPLNQTLPKASISSRNVIDTPYSVEPINNINLITGQITIPTANTYGRLFIAPHTGNYVNIETMITNVASGALQFGIYSKTGNLMGKTTAVADSSKSNGWVGSSFWYDAAGAMKTTAGVYLTGGEAYFIAYHCTSTSTGFAGFSGLPTYSAPSALVNPMQAYGVGAIPATLTLNGSMSTVFPYIKIEVM